MELFIASGRTHELYCTNICTGNKSHRVPKPEDWQRIGDASMRARVALRQHSCKSKALIAAQIANFTQIVLFWLLFLVRCYVEKEKARWCR